MRVFADPGQHWGQVIEECAELIVAIRHRVRGRIEDAAVAEEIADVMIVAAKARLLIGPELVDRILEAKLERFEKRLDAEEARQKAGLPPKGF